MTEHKSCENKGSCFFCLNFDIGIYTSPCKDCITTKERLNWQPKPTTDKPLESTSNMQNPTQHTGNDIKEVEDKSAEYEKEKSKLILELEDEVSDFANGIQVFYEALRKLEALAIAEGERRASEKNKCKSPCCQNCEWNRAEGERIGYKKAQVDITNGDYKFCYTLEDLKAERQQAIREVVVAIENVCKEKMDTFICTDGTTPPPCYACSFTKLKQAIEKIGEGV